MAVDKLKLQVVLAAVDKASGVLKGLSKNGGDLAKKFRDAKAKLHEFEAQQRDVAALQKLGHEMTLTSQKAKGLQVMLEQAGRTSGTTAAQQRKLKQDLDAVNRQLSAQKARAIDMRAALSSTGVTNLTRAEAELTQKIKAGTAALAAQKAELDRVMERERKLAALKEKHARIMEKWAIHAGAGMAARAEGQAIASTGIVPIQAYAAAEDAAVGLKVAMMGAGAQVPPAYEKIKGLAEQLGNKLPGTTADFQNMMTMLVRQGMSAEKILGGVGQASAYMAVQLKKSPEAAAEFASKMQDATRTTDSDMMALMDTIQRAFYLGVDDSNLLQGFSKLSPALSILRKEGVGAAKDLAPLLVMADQAGMAGEAAGNAYRKIFQAAMGTEKIDDANAALAGTGVKLNFTDGKGEFGGMQQMFAQLQQLKGVATQQRLEALKEAFGADAETLQALTLMIEKGQDGYNDVARRMATQADLQTRVNEQLGTLKNLWDAASGTFTNTMATFGEAMAPEIKALTEWFGKASEKVGAFAKENPGLTKAIGLTILGMGGLLVVGGTLLTLFSAFALKAALVRFALSRLGLGMASTATKGPLLYRLGSMLGRSWGIAKQAAVLFAKVLGHMGTALSWVARMGFGALKTVGTGLMWLARLAMGHPLLAIITLIAMGAIYIWKNWDTLGPKIKGIWDSVTTYMSGLVGRFSTIGGQIIDGLMGGLRAKWDAAKTWFADMGTQIAQTARNALGIKSPSRVFAEIGAHVMGGLDVGLARGEDGPLSRMKGAAAKLTSLGAGLTLGTAALAMSAQVQAPDMTAPTLARHAGASAPNGYKTGASATPIQQGSSIQITINAAPGMDPQAVAKAVAAELDRRDRNTRARVRSAMHDID